MNFNRKAERVLRYEKDRERTEPLMSWEEINRAEIESWDWGGNDQYTYPSSPLPSVQTQRTLCHGCGAVCSGNLKTDYSNICLECFESIIESFYQIHSSEPDLKVKGKVNEKLSKKESSLPLYQLTPLRT